MKIILDYTTGSVTDFTAKPRRVGMLLVGTNGKMRFDHDAGYSIFDSSAGGYNIPAGGIPLTDLAVGVQNLLGLAGTALQSFTETDPTVPAWAKTPQKPSYTASEVGAATTGELSATSQSLRTSRQSAECKSAITSSTRERQQERFSVFQRQSVEWCNRHRQLLGQRQATFAEQPVHRDRHAHACAATEAVTTTAATNIETLKMRRIQ